MRARTMIFFIPIITHCVAVTIAMVTDTVSQTHARHHIYTDHRYVELLPSGYGFI